ncbi:MAG: potassium transporter TrkG, partial [Chloroflexota bacterium]
TGEPVIFNRRIPLSLIFRALTVLVLFFLFHFVMTLALTATEHLYGERQTFLQMLFETMSAQATVGLTNGITPELSTPGKVVLIFTMFVGRLGPLTVVYALQRRARARRYRFPEGNVHIG